MTDPNLEIAALLLDLCEVYRPAPKFWGYKNASRSIRRHPEFFSDLTDKETLKIAGVGPASLRVGREYLDTGESATVTRTVGESGKAKEIDARRALRQNFLFAGAARRNQQAEQEVRRRVSRLQRSRGKHPRGRVARHGPGRAA